MPLLKLSLSIGILMLVDQVSAQQSKVVLPLPKSLVNQVAQKTGVAVKEQMQAKVATTLELVDVSGDSVVLGYFSANAVENDRIAIWSPVSRQEWLKGALGEDAGNAYANRGVAGLYVINDISVGRFSNGNYVRIKGAIYESPIGGNNYRLVSNIDSFFTDNSTEITAATETVANALNATAVSAKSGMVKLATEKGLTKEQVIKIQKEKYAYIGNSSFASGIYMSYEEFKQGKPGFGQFYLKTDTLNKKMEVNSFSHADSTLRPVPGAWGVAVANELYVFRDGMLFPVEAVGNNLILSKFIDPDTRKNNGQFWRTNFGGRLSQLEAANPFDNQYVIKMENYRNRGVSGEASRLNADTGLPEL